MLKINRSTTGDVFKELMTEMYYIIDSLFLLNPTLERSKINTIALRHTFLTYKHLSIVLVIQPECGY